MERYTLTPHQLTHAAATRRHGLAPGLKRAIAIGLLALIAVGPTSVSPVLAAPPETEGQAMIAAWPPPPGSTGGISTLAEWEPPR